MSEADFRIVYDVRREDYVAMNLYIHEQAPWYRRNRRGYMFNAAACMFPYAFLVFLLQGIVSQWESTFIWRGAILFSLVVAALFALHARNAGDRGVRRNAGSVVDCGWVKNTVCRHTMELWDEYLQNRTEFTEQRVLWRGIEKLVLDDDRAWVFTNGETAFLLARGNVVAGDFDGFVAALKSRYQSALQVPHPAIKKARP